MKAGCVQTVSMMTRQLTDDELAMVQYIRSADPAATQPVPRLLTESLRRITQSANPVDTLRQEFDSVVELALRYDMQQGTISER